MAQKSKIPAECIEEVKHPIITLEENGKKMTFNNEQRKAIKKVRVDGCAVKAGIRCDWLVIGEDDLEHFVELKGSDVVHACNQLIESITQLSSDHAKAAKHSFVIASRLAPAISSRIQNLKRHFKDKFNCQLTIKNTKHEIEL